MIVFLIIINILLFLSYRSFLKSNIEEYPIKRYKDYKKRQEEKIKRNRKLIDLLAEETKNKN